MRPSISAVAIAKTSSGATTASAPTWRSNARQDSHSETPWARCSPDARTLGESRVGRGAGDRRAELLLGDCDLCDVGQRDAVLGRGDFGEDRNRDLRWCTAADVEPDWSVQASDL